MARTRKTPPSPEDAPLRLHEWFELFGLDDKAAAEMLGVKPPTVNRWINGKRGVKDREKQRIADALGISPGDLFRVPNEDDIARIVAAALSRKDGPKTLPKEIASRILAKDRQ